MSHERTTVDVDVTPILKQGNETYCEIDPAPGSGGHVKGGVIKLGKGTGPHVINFTLVGSAISAEAGDHCWKSEDEESCGAGSAAVNSAFWSDRGSCPDSPTQDNQVTDVTVVGKVLTVTIDPDGSKNALHYRLNFADGTYFDPIIIHM